MKKALYFIFCVVVAMIGNNIHYSTFWTIIDFIFAPIALVKWIVFQEINMTIIESTFSWFMK